MSIDQEQSTLESAHVTHRRTLPSAVGEPMVWLTGSALVLCLGMIAVLLVLVINNGLRTFWPGDIDRLTLNDGEQVMGIRVSEDSSGRYLYRVGNRDIGQESFRWIDGDEIVEREQPDDAVMLEREAWGVWFGIPESIEEVGEDGTRTKLTNGSAQTLEEFAQRHEAARSRRASGEAMRKRELGKINHGIESARLAVSEAEMGVVRRATARDRLGWVSWSLVLGSVVFAAALWWVKKDAGVGIGSAGVRAGKMTRFGCAVVVVFGLVGLWIGGPWRQAGLSEAQRDAVIAESESEMARLQSEYERVLGEIREGEEIDGRERFVVVEPTTDRFAPIAQTQGDEPMMLSQVVRMVPANQLSVGGKLHVL